MAPPDFQVPGGKEDARNQSSCDIVPVKVLGPYKDSSCVGENASVILPVQILHRGKD